MVQLIFGMVALSALSACLSPPPITPAPVTSAITHRLYEMPTQTVSPVHTLFDNNIAWIDDRRVLFEGLDRMLRDPVDMNDGTPVAMRGLYVWNVQTNDVVRHTNEALRSPLCFADGNIAYSVYRRGRTVWLEGPFGKERELDALPQGERALNSFTCTTYDRATLPRPQIGGGIEPLRPEHGWIEHVHGSSWHRSPNGNLTQLTYSGRPIGTVRPQKYSFHSNKYIFWRPSQATWLIGPDGTVQQQLPPLGMPNRGRLEPADKDKILWRLTEVNVRASWDPGDSGLYVFSAHLAPQRLIRGVIEAMQVHAGGCWVAAIVDPWDREGRQHQLTAVNVCQ
jgi:hypothetical protein